jgi:hypothetical protein
MGAYEQHSAGCAASQLFGTVVGAAMGGVKGSYPLSSGIAAQGGRSDASASGDAGPLGAARTRSWLGSGTAILLRHLPREIRWSCGRYRHAARHLLECSSLRHNRLPSETGSQKSSSQQTLRWRKTDSNSPSHLRGVGTCSDFSQRVGDLNVTPQEPRGLRILDGCPSVGEDLRRSPTLHGRCPQPRFWRSMYVRGPAYPPAENV